MNGLLSIGAYLPRHRLNRADIRSTLGTGGGKGSRSVASYDEDTVSMAVEAGRKALAGLGAADARPQRLYFATPAPPYLDKTNAAVIHAALDLDRSAFAADLGGSARSAMGALLAAADSSVPALALLADLRTGRPGSTDEAAGGDGAAALLFGPGSDPTPVLATLLASAATTEEFLDRWRTPGSAGSRTWEERFGEHVYGPLAEEAFAAALKQADRTPDQVDHLIACGLAERAVKAFARSSGVRAGALVPDLTDVVGNTGAAQPGILLADVLSRAEPGELIAVVLLADGASVLLLETTEAVATRRPAPSVATQVASGTAVPYPTFLTWRGFLDREPPRRPEPDAPAGPPAHRSGGYKLAFRATRCRACGSVNLPPSRVCFKCSAVDEMDSVAMSSVAGTVATFTIDRLAYTPSPPMIAVVVDFDGGGRFRCELADSLPGEIAIGARVELTFRRLLTADGVHNYFWKAKPL
jgi:3-hydroxy-3-methylglutaryl CoA synthase/uncharacterized OB-fold protein